MKIPFLNRFFEKRSNLANPQQWLLNILGGGFESKAGIKINYETAIKVSAVFACVNLVSQTMASLPLPLYRKRERGKDKADNHPIYVLIHDLANPETTAFDFWVMYIVNLLLTGDAFGYVKRDGNGNIVELWNVPTGNVTIFRNKETGELYYKIREDDNKEFVLYPENIMHTRGMRFASKDKTLDPIKIAREALGLSVALEEYGSTYFKNGANVGGIVEVPGVLKEDAFKRFKDSFNEKFSGIGNSNKVLFLESGSKFIKMGNSPNESQAIESRKFQVIEIARFFNVPPHKIMDLEKATFSNIEQQSIEFVQSCIHPMAVRLEQSIFKDLLGISERKKYFAKFNLNGLLRGDSTARKEFYQAGIQNGWFSPNDVRELEDLNAIDSGDIYMVNGNMIPLNQLEEVLKQKMKGGDTNGQGNQNAGGGSGT